MRLMAYACAVWRDPIRALPLAAAGAFLVAWLHFWSGLNHGTGRDWVMGSLWRFWVPPAVAAAVLLVTGWFAWRAEQSRAWLSSAFLGALAGLPAWLAALIPAGIAAILMGPRRGPAVWFAAADSAALGIRDAFALTFVFAGPVALAMVTAVNWLRARNRRPPAALSTIFSGTAAGTTLLVLVAFAAFVVPGDPKERARANDPNEARRSIQVAQDGANQALWRAARQGNVTAIENLLRSGRSPDVANDFGETALILAARECHPDAVTALLRHGASVAWKDRQGRDALAHAFRQRYRANCGPTILALSQAGAPLGRDALCARLVEEASAQDTGLVVALAQIAYRNGWKDILAIGYATATRYYQRRNAEAIAAYGPLPPAGSCEPADPATAGTR
jgi:ankyrin repeat protein